MEVGIIGLGRMGLNMARRLLRGGHAVFAHNHTPGKIRDAEAEGARGVVELTDFKRMEPPRSVWVMVPAGEPTRETIGRVADVLSAGDTIIDGGNSYYRDSVARHAELKARGIHFLDQGTSGGIWGLKVGYCIMVGGAREPFERAEPALRTLAPPDGYRLVGGPGAGHFSKMVHNGIEYGLMQAYAEGFELLQASEFDYDLQEIAHLWNQGSVVRSWLLELAERAFERDEALSGIADYVEDSGEGRWTVIEAMERDVPAPVITLALQNRFRSRQEVSFQAKMLAALRNEFGGHAVRSTARSPKE